MQMNLKLVTWEGDLTQFLVNAETDEEAIDLAIEANKEIDITFHDKDMDDKSTYSVEDVDFMMLCELFKRNDMAGKYENTIAFYD